MKKLNDCIIENCIPTPSSCVEWNGGDIKALGICNGDSLNNIVWEIVDKLESLVGEDIASFDISELLSLCKTKAPLEINLISILSIIKNNQICLKDYIDILSTEIGLLAKEQNINVNLKCLADLDNLGNQLSITREGLDQLIINEICDGKTRFTTIESKITILQNEINDIDPHAHVDELSFATCLDGAVKPTSTQLVKTSQILCDLQNATGTPIEIAQALSKTPAGWNTKFGSIVGWDFTPDEWSDNYGNLLLAFNNLLTRIETIENTCCAVSCDDLKLGFSVLWSTDKTSVILTFAPGAGTKIPSGFIDAGTTGTITDVNGSIVYFSTVISTNHEEEVYITGLDTSQPLQVHLDAKMSNGSITCDRCLDKTVTSSTGCAYCELTATGDDSASAIVVYYTLVNSYQPIPVFTTTTTTAAP